MSVRSELTVRLAAFAATYTNTTVIPNTTALPLSIENTSFVKPLDNAPFLEMFILPAATIDVTVDGTRQREVGVMQINVWTPTNKGTAQTDAIVAGIRAAFPRVPITGSVSIENTASVKQAIIDPSGYRITPIIIPYRLETEY